MRPAVLMLSERRPDSDALGGIEVHVADLLTYAREGVTLHSAHASGRRLVVEAWKAGRRSEIAALELGELSRDPLDRPALANAIEAALLATRSEILHVHSPALGPRAIAAAIDASGVRCVVTLHDHALACENLHLLELGERYCELPEDRARCDRCLARTLARPPGRLPAWQSAMSELVERTDAIVAPSASVAALVGSVHPTLQRKLKKIPWGVPRASQIGITGSAGPLRIAVVGVLADVKGSRRLPELFAATADLDVEWHVFGAREGRSVAELRRACTRLVLHGAYRRAELGQLLASAGCELALLPSVAPEAFGMVLAELAALGCPALVSRLGAFEERVVGLGAGWTFDPWSSAELRQRLQELLSDRGKLVAAADNLRKLPSFTPADMARAHVSVWRDVVALGPTRVVSDERRQAARSRLARERRRPSLVVPAVRALRRSAFYRDFSVRAWLPEKFRARVEQKLSALLSHWTNL